MAQLTWMHKINIIFNIAHSQRMCPLYIRNILYNAITIYIREQHSHFLHILNMWYTQSTRSLSLFANQNYTVVQSYLQFPTCVYTLRSWNQNYSIYNFDASHVRYIVTGKIVKLATVDVLWWSGLKPTSYFGQSHEMMSQTSILSMTLEW